MTWGLMAFNVMVFLLETRLPEPLLERLFYFLGVVPLRVAHPVYASQTGWGTFWPWPFLTGIFLHGGWIHILGNMWTLWIFGDNVEDKMGPWRFLVFYLLSGIAASIIHIISNPLSTAPIIGASGAIAGVMGAYYTLFPRAKILIMVPVFIFPFFFEIPAVFYLAFWFLGQVFSGTLSLVAPLFSGGIAWWAHIGGFAFGMIINRIFVR